MQTYFTVHFREICIIHEDYNEVRIVDDRKYIIALILFFSIGASLNFTDPLKFASFFFFSKFEEYHQNFRFDHHSNKKLIYFAYCYISQ